MGYPFTKPQSRYPHKRRHFSAPYPNAMGGFTDGVFTAYNPWATPNYIKAEPTGVNGLGLDLMSSIKQQMMGGEKCASKGTVQPCMDHCMRDILAKTIESKLPSFIKTAYNTAKDAVDLIPGVEMSSLYWIIYTGVKGLQKGVLDGIQLAAMEGTAAFTKFYNNKILPFVVPKINESLNNTVNTYWKKGKVSVDEAMLKKLGPVMLKAVTDVMSKCRQEAGLVPGTNYEAAPKQSTGLIPAIVPQGFLPPALTQTPGLITSVPNWKAKCTTAGGKPRFDAAYYPNGRWICDPTILPATGMQIAAKKPLPTIAIVAGIGLLALALKR